MAPTSQVVPTKKLLYIYMGNNIAIGTSLTIVSLALSTNVYQKNGKSSQWLLIFFISQIAIAKSTLFNSM